MTSRLRSLLLPLAAALCLLLLAGCTSSDPGQTPSQALARAKKLLDKTASVHIDLATDALPRSSSGLLSADGVGTHDPAFKGSFLYADKGGERLKAAVVAVDGVVYAQLPFLDHYVKVDPAVYRAPDPAQLMATEGGLSSVLTDVRSPKSQGRTRQGSQVLHEYTGTVPGKAVAALIPTAATTPFQARVALDDNGRPVTVALTGRFYPDADPLTYTVTLSDYGAQTTIKAP